MATIEPRDVGLIWILALASRFMQALHDGVALHLALFLFVPLAALLLVLSLMGMVKCGHIQRGGLRVRDGPAAEHTRQLDAGDAADVHEARCGHTQRI
jgi:hypothetical protein